MCAAADIDDITLIIDVRDDHEPSSDLPASAALVISNVSTDTADTVADVSTPFRRDSDDSNTTSKILSVVETAGVVEPASPDDRADSNRAAIDLLLWKLTELERRITLGQVRNATARCTAAPLRDQFFSERERELTFTFAICYRPSVCLSLSSRYRKPYMSFRLVPKSVTLNDLERRNGGMAFILRYHTELWTIYEYYV